MRAVTERDRETARRSYVLGALDAEFGGRERRAHPWWAIASIGGAVTLVLVGVGFALGLLAGPAVVVEVTPNGETEVGVSTPGG